MVRWTGAEDKDPSLQHVLEVIRVKTGIALKANDFAMLENRPLATSHFTMLAQVIENVPVQSQSIRIWTNRQTGETIQIEAFIDAPPHKNSWGPLMKHRDLDSATTLEIAKSQVAKNVDDKGLYGATWQDVWEKGDLVRVVKGTGKHGKHEVHISLRLRRVVGYEYKEFPQADSEFSLPIQIYPIFEEVPESKGKLLERVPSELRYLKSRVIRPKSDPFAALRTQHYRDDQYDPILGYTVEGRAKGLWAMGFIKDQVNELVSRLPQTPNNFSNGVMLEGRYASVHLHPDIYRSFKGIGFAPEVSAQFKPLWKTMEEDSNHEEMLPLAAFFGRPILSATEAYDRLARRLPTHDPVSYLNDGFDEIQVYWAVNQMFDSLRPMGFSDPELSTRRFNAFLFDPDISYRDNAFYHDDTINFTTYSPTGHNMARDNSTIWHELGHGVMDRLMGDLIRLADTGGLSEGMADFVAQLVINEVANGKSYEGMKDLRIFNNTGFYLTNEVHDDGEAYGGAMNDLLVSAMELYGRDGLVKVTDVVLEAMRLTRNHPGLTAVDWFSHLLFADEVGNAPVRDPGELKEMIVSALAGRNFNLDGSPAATFSLKNGEQEVVAGVPGSRQNPIKHELKAAETVSYKLSVALHSTPTYSFKYPVTVKVGLRGGPLQGGIKWDGEEAGALTFTLAKDDEVLTVPLTAHGTCDEVNRPDGSCVDFAYVQIWNKDEVKKPAAKKRFYLRVVPQK